MSAIRTNYPPLALNPVPDSDVELQCPGCKTLTIQISNQAVYITFGSMPAGLGGPVIYEPNPEPYQPVVGSLNRPFDAFKVRALTPAAQLPAGASQAAVYLTPRQ